MRIPLFLPGGRLSRSSPITDFPLRFRATLALVATIVGVPLCAQGQLDRFHWIPPIFAAPADGGGSGNVDDHYLWLSTPETGVVTVTITDGDGDSIVRTVSNASPVLVALGSYSGGAYNENSGIAINGNIVDLSRLNTVTGEGLFISATAPVYANIRHLAGFQGGSLTAKGCPALGTEFRIGVMRDRGPRAAQAGVRGNFASVMATVDGTTVTISEIKPTVTFSGAGAPTNGSTVVLNANESYTFGIDGTDVPDSPAGTQWLNDFNGTLISADNPVVVNSGTFLGSPTSNSARDIGIDQTAPVRRAGTEYVINRGGGNASSDIESTTVIATVPNTNVTVNGGTLNFTLTGAGDYRFVTNQFQTIPTQPAAGSMLIESDQPVLVYQTVGGSNSAATPGFNFVPPLDLDIATFVDNIPDITQLGNARLNVVARSGQPVTVNGLPIGVPARPVPGTSDWVAYTRTAQLRGNVKVSSGGPIQVGFTTLSGAVGSAGYFSGFPSFKPLVQFDDPNFRCFSGMPGFTAVLVASDPSGGLFASYEWFFESGTPVEALFPGSTSTLSIPGDTLTVPVPGNYFVRATLTPGAPCPAEDSAVVEVLSCPDPVGNDDVACIAPTRGVPSVISVLDNDEVGLDYTLVPVLSGAPITVTSIVTPPTRGTATITGGGTTITYTPTSLIDQDVLEYEVTNAFGLTDTASVLIKNPYFWGKGWFAGLVVQNGVEGDPAATWQNTGFVRIHISYTGVFSGEVRVNGELYRVRDAFPLDGFWSGNFTSHYGLTVPVEMQLDVTNYTYLISGTVDPGGLDSTFSMYKNLYLERIPGADPAPPRIPPPAGLFLTVPQEGLYTCATDKPADPALPQGYGAGSGRVLRTGFAFLNGKLGDNASFSSGAHLKWTNEYPFNARVYRPTGNVHGTVYFEETPGVSDGDGTLHWYKPPMPRIAPYYYHSGFSAAATLVLSRYVPPGAGALLPYANGTLDVEGGLVSHAPFSTSFSVGSAITPTPGTYGVQIPYFYPLRGSFRGTFVDDTNPIYRGRLKRWFDGIVFQKQGLLLGSFRGNGMVLTNPKPPLVPFGASGSISGYEITGGLTLPPAR